MKQQFEVLWIDHEIMDDETNKVQSTVIDGSTPRWAEEMPSTVFRAIYKI